MEIMEELLNEKGKEAAMDDDSEPADIADRAYKEWLEEPQTFGECEDEQQE